MQSETRAPAAAAPASHLSRTLLLSKPPTCMSTRPERERQRETERDREKEREGERKREKKRKREGGRKGYTLFPVVSTLLRNTATEVLSSGRHPLSSGKHPLKKHPQRRFWQKNS